MSINRVLTREEWDAEVAEMVERSGPIPYASLAAGCALRLIGYVQAGDSSPARKPRAYSYTTNGTTYNVGEDGVTRMAKKFQQEGTA